MRDHGSAPGRTTGNRLRGQRDRPPPAPDSDWIAPQIRHRILQYRGKRFSLKLDELVWSYLDRLASKSDVRLNELISSLVDRTGKSSVTATIRSFCLQQALDAADELRRGVDERAMTGAGVSVALIADACPSPCFVVSQDNIIRRTNAPAQSWASVREAGLIGKSLEHYFQIKAALPLAEIVRQFGDGAMSVVPARILYLRPGRIVTARANLCPAAVRGPRDLLYMVLVDARP